MYKHILLLLRYGAKISSHNMSPNGRSTYICINISCSYLYMEHRFRRIRYERTIFYILVAKLASTGFVCFNDCFKKKIFLSSLSFGSVTSFFFSKDYKFFFFSFSDITFFFFLSFHPNCLFIDYTTSIMSLFGLYHLFLVFLKTIPLRSCLFYRLYHFLLVFLKTIPLFSCLSLDYTTSFLSVFGLYHFFLVFL